MYYIYYIYIHYICICIYVYIYQIYLFVGGSVGELFVDPVCVELRQIRHVNVLVHHRPSELKKVVRNIVRGAPTLSM